MQEQNSINIIVAKIQKGEHFGLFDEGEKCYFEDGTKVSYTNLWGALRAIHSLPAIHHKSVAELCPEAFEGTHNYSFSRHRWKKNPNGEPMQKTTMGHYVKKLFSFLAAVH